MLPLLSENPSAQVIDSDMVPWGFGA